MAKVYLSVFMLVLLSSCASSKGYNLNIGFEFTKRVDKPIYVTGFLHKRSNYQQGIVSEVLVDQQIVNKELYPYTHAITENLIEILENQKEVEELVLFSERKWVKETGIHIDIEIFEEAALDPTYGHFRYDLQYSFSMYGRPTFKKRIRKSSGGFGGCLQCISSEIVVNKINREIMKELHKWWTPLS